MRKLMLLAALLAMVLVAAVPAIAQVTQDTELEGEAADIDQSFEITGGGDNGSQCVGVNGTANTGNSQNVTGVIQYDSEADEFEFDDTGSDLTVDGTSTTTCDQQTNQAAAAG